MRTIRNNWMLHFLRRMKEIQGSAGAHIVLDPQMDDLVSCLCCFDIRLPFYDAPMRTSGAALNFKGGYSLYSNCVC